MNPEMRLAGTNDLPALLRFVEAYHNHDDLPFDNETTASALTTLLESKELGRIWLIETEGRAVGYLVLCFGYSIEFLGRDAFVDELYLEATYRGRGMGRKVLAWVREEARNLQLKAVHLEVDRHNARAKHLYEGAGFKARGDFQLMSLYVEPRPSS